jgi:hypothetical protein
MTRKQKTYAREDNDSDHEQYTTTILSHGDVASVINVDADNAREHTPVPRDNFNNVFNCFQQLKCYCDENYLCVFDKAAAADFHASLKRYVTDL